MRLVPLEKKEIRQIYRRHLKKDFPRSERKPLRFILSGCKKGYYECLGAKEGEELLAYAFAAEAEGALLLDYLAVVSGRRGGGTGSGVIALLGERYAARRFLLGEVESIESAKDGEERRTRERRIAFYLKNGWARTGAKVGLFGVDMDLIALPLSESPDTERAARALEDVYRVMFPWAVKAGMVKIKK